MIPWIQNNMFRAYWKPLFKEMNDEERQYDHFQQDSTTEHTANNSMRVLQEVSNDRIISTELWPKTPPVLNICNFYLWGERVQEQPLHCWSPPEWDHECECFDYVRWTSVCFTGILSRMWGVSDIVKADSDHFEHWVTSWQVPLAISIIKS
jgi:hypothetical protein